MLRFRMVRINVEQFAILANDVPAGKITIDTNIGVKASVPDRKIALEVEFNFTSIEEKIMVLKQLSGSVSAFKIKKTKNHETEF